MHVNGNVPLKRASIAPTATGHRLVVAHYSVHLFIYSWRASFWGKLGTNCMPIQPWKTQQPYE